MAQLRNPYIAGTPLRQGRGFFGRQDTLDWVARELRNPATNTLVLFGQRRIGKTSLLLQLQHTMPAEEFLPIYFDLQDQATRSLGQVLADLADTVAEQAGLEPPEPAQFDNKGHFFQHVFLSQLYQTLGQDCRPVFLLDEFDVLDEAAESKLPGETAARALFPFLRRVMTEDTRPAFVLAVGRRAEDLSTDFTATFKTALVREIWVLDKENANALVRQAEVNNTLSFTDQAVVHILNLTNCHPFLTQLLCQRIWQRVCAKKYATPPLIGIPEIEAAIPDALEAGNQALVWIWDGLGPAEKIYAAALAEIADEGQTMPEDQVAQVLVEHAERLRRREVQLAPRDLEKRRVLEKVGEREYRFAVELFRRWVCKNKPLREVKNELDRIEPVADRLYGLGRDFLDRRQFDTAIRYFGEALAANPRHFRARLDQGEAFLELGQTDDAVAELEHAYELDREEAYLPLIRTLLAHAEARERAGDGYGALEACQRALEILPDEPKALKMRETILQAILKQRPKERRRSRIAWVLVGAFALVLMVILLVWTQGWGMPSPPPTVVVITLPPPAATPTATPEPPTPTPTAALPVRPGTPAPQPEVIISADKVDQVVPLAHWGRGTANEVVYSPDGQMVAVATSLGIYLYDSETLEEMRFIEADGWVRSVAFSPDGGTLASGSDAKKVQLWRAVDGSLLRTLEGHTDWVRSVAFSPDGQILASGADDRTVRLWRVSDGALLRVLKGHSNEVWSAAFSPDGAMLASASCGELVDGWNCVKGEIYLWRVSDGSLLRTLEGHAGWVRRVAFSPDGATLASGSDDNTVRLWRADDGVLLHTLREHASDVYSVAFSPDSAKLASASSDSTVRLWRVSDQALLRTLEEHTDQVWSVAFSPDGANLLSASWDGSVRLWQVEDGSPLRMLEGYIARVRDVAFSPDRAMLAASSDDNVVRLWRADDGAPLFTLREHMADVDSVAFSPDGTLLASASDDDKVRLWQVSDGTLLHTLPECAGDASSVAFSPDGTILAAGVCGEMEDWMCVSGEIHLWRVSDRSLLNTLEGHTSYVRGLAFSSNGKLLASASDDKTVRVWQVSDGALLQPLEEHSGVNSVAFSPDSATLVSAADDYTIRLWQVDNGTALHILEGHTGIVNDVVFSLNGALVASASDDNTVRLWRVSDGAQLRVLRGHSGDVESVAFSPDGTILASGAYDGTVWLWGVVED
jgi:WD40 repeat protein/tetratricopeptide (TPR) repeat protein